MKLKRQKTLLKGMAVAMSLGLLTACGGAPASSSTGDATAETGSSESAPAEQTESGGEGKVITVWTKDRADSEYMQAAVDDYNANNTHGYTVE